VAIAIFINNSHNHEEEASEIRCCPVATRVTNPNHHKKRHHKQEIDGPVNLVVVKMSNPTRHLGVRVDNGVGEDRSTPQPWKKNPAAVVLFIPFEKMSADGIAIPALEVIPFPCLRHLDGPTRKKCPRLDKTLTQGCTKK